MSLQSHGTNLSTSAASRASARFLLAWLPLLLSAVLLQAPLWLNPGYFSHDELQWAAFADVARWQELRWVAWTDVTAFQYRPLTFNLWLLLSHWLAPHPQAFHLLWVLLGTVNALLLSALLRGAGTTPRVALLGALSFALSPYAVYVHGWVGTLADLLWVGFGLGLALLGQSARAGSRALETVALAAALTTLALLSKEAAIVLPALAALAWLLAGRQRAWGWITLGSAFPTLIYLALRLQLVLFATREPGLYSWELGAIPVRCFEYLVFPYAINVFEVFGLASYASASRLAAVALVAVILHLAVWRAAPRLALALLVGGVIALGPVLILNAAASQYGYGYAALAAGLVALAWAPAGRFARTGIALAAVLVLAHGGFVQYRMLEVGRAHADFMPHLIAALQADPQQDFRLFPARRHLHFAYQRLTFHIPRVGGTPLGARVSVVDDPAKATHRIEVDGRITALAP